MGAVEELLRIEINGETVGYCYRVSTVRHFLQRVSFDELESLQVLKVPAHEVNKELVTCH